MKNRSGLLDDIEIASTPMRDDAPVVPLPRVALDNPLIAGDAEFLRLYAILCAYAADRTGWVWSNGGMARIEKGTLLTTYGALAKLWGLSREQTRRRLRRMMCAGLIGLHSTVAGGYGGTEDDGDPPPIAKGKIVAVRGLADDALIEDATDGDDG